MKYRLFYSGLASTPNSVGLLCVDTNEVICEIEVSLPSGKETREKYNKIKSLLIKKYACILN